ncbi:hypothetical protein GGR52DRAFT_526386 [Hypoxylon sp. FL1284]|nr:hypothetical protein GGR52DRAFT_526386 [Hypoxylon sp. FL1284]
MDDNIDIPTWRRTRLDPEPIYCAAPSPTNPDDVICLGSDEELDEPAKVAKRLRYEAQALRYLDGQPMHILSASLCGPFDKASGWNNPWLPKQPPTKEPLSEQPQPPAKPLQDAKQQPLRRSKRLAEQDEATPDTDNSIRCQLPSPDSNRGSHMMSTPLETDKHIQIAAWAKEVTYLGKLVKDPFWAPNQMLNQENTGSDRKRPRGKDWLKGGKQSKRMKPESFQTTAVSTPMPVPRASTRSRSVPTKSHYGKQSGLPNTVVSRSFELATPSSTDNQDGSEIVYNDMIDTSAAYENASPQGQLSNAAAPANNRSKMPVLGTGPDETHNQSLPMSSPEEQTTIHPSQQAPEDAMKQGMQSQDEVGLESYLDRSFHYRARPPRKTTPVPDPGFPTTASCLQLTQTGTPESSSHADVVMVAVAEKETQSQERVPMNRHTDDSDIQPSQSHKIISCATPAGDESPECQEALIESVGPMSVEPDSASTTETINSSSTEAGDMGTKGLGPIHGDLQAPPTVAEIKPLGTSTPLMSHATTEVHLTRPESSVEEASAFIHDLADVGQAEPTEASKSPTHSTLSTNAMLVPEPHDARQKLEVAARDDGADFKLDSAITPSSQVKQEFAEAVASTPRNLQAIPEFQGDVIMDSEAQDTIVCRRSPWVPDLPPGADLTEEYIKSEPIDEPMGSYPYQLTLLTSQTSSGEVSRIGPSQQSPCARAVSEHVESNDQEHHFTTPTGPTPPDTSHVPAASGEHQSPWDDADMDISSYTNIAPISSTPETESSADKSEQRSSDYPCHAPVTPPPVSTSLIRTPKFEKSILPFALFNTPSPKRRARQLSGRRSLTGKTRSILSSARRSNPWSSGRSNRRVSFALLPTGEDDTQVLSAPALSVSRAASPPPQTMVDAEDEDVDGNYKKHFEAMKRRASAEGAQRQRQPQLLPSFSQQKPLSPAIDAMAAAFRDADACVALPQGDLVGDPGKDADHDMGDVEQSPWRKESQGVDDVAAVMDNLGEFLGAWDVEAELVKERQ